jgi:hypothetical protein
MSCYNELWKHKGHYNLSANHEAPLPLQVLFSAHLAPLLRVSLWHSVWQQHLLLPRVLGLSPADLGD